MTNPKFHIFDKTVTFETAKRNRSCKTIGCSQGYTIYPGETHLAIYDEVGIRTNYCFGCADDRLKKLEHQVNDASAALNFVKQEWERKKSGIP